MSKVLLLIYAYFLTSLWSVNLMLSSVALSINENDNFNLYGDHIYFRTNQYSQMSQSDFSDHEQQANKIKEPAERKYGCPCGKWYLSYPALFTHVKQKHQGKPPGTLIKPKTDKARGRPRLPTVNPDEDISIANYDCAEELQKVLENKEINYEQQYQMSAGKETCQDMGSEFLRAFSSDEIDKKVLVCFLNYIRYFVRQKYDDTYWQTHKPNQIIDISNQIVKDLQNHKAEYPLDKELLIELLFILFRWMYKNKWTDHKLVKRSSQSQPQQEQKQNQKIVE